MELWRTKSQAAWVEGAHPPHSLPLQTSLRSLPQHSPQPGPKAVSPPPLSSVAQGKGATQGSYLSAGEPRLLHTATYGRGKAEGHNHEFSDDAKAQEQSRYPVPPCAAFPAPAFGSTAS